RCFFRPHTGTCRLALVRVTLHGGPEGGERPVTRRLSHFGERRPDLLALVWSHLHPLLGEALFEPAPGPDPLLFSIDPGQRGKGDALAVAADVVEVSPHRLTQGVSAVVLVEPENLRVGIAQELRGE